VVLVGIANVAAVGVLDGKATGALIRLLCVACAVAVGGIVVVAAAVAVRGTGVALAVAES